MAPKAKVTSYKVSTDGPTTVGIVAAIDEPVKDGVDIMSISLGYEASLFYTDSLTVIACGAERKGVFHRLFSMILHLGGGSILTGESLYPVKVNHTAMAPLASLSCQDSDITPEKVKGKIVVCFHQSADDSQVRKADGEGLISMDSTTWTRDDIMNPEFTIPGIVLSRAHGEKLRTYMASATHPTTSFSFACEAVTGENQASTVMVFSSRGPNPEVLKPDIVAPVVNIVAALIDPSSAQNRSIYVMESGTSMVCPHVAGITTLIKKQHPDWSLTMIRSALITTARVLDLYMAVFQGRGVTVATPLPAWAGHVRSQLAIDPGVVYDADARDYVDFLCALNYSRIRFGCSRPTWQPAPARHYPVDPLASTIHC